LVRKKVKSRYISLFTENGPETGPENGSENGTESGLGMKLFLFKIYLYNDFQVPECIQNFQKALKADFEG